MPHYPRSRALSLVVLRGPQERAATARTLSTLEEVENEGVNADSMERGLNGAPAELLRQAPASPTAREMDAANRCAAELLEASNATAAAAAAAAAAANTAVHCNGAAQSCLTCIWVPKTVLCLPSCLYEHPIGVTG